MTEKLVKDHISFINHNRPLPPVTIEDLNTKIEFKDRKYLNAELKEMFFNLKLIQSYGSGIRRAKNSLNDIGSPALVYEPDNDTDDYTLVTAYINEEYARVRAEEEGNARKEKKPDENVGINVGIKLSSEANALLSGYGKKKREVASNILKAICDNNQITAPEIADTIGSTKRTVQRYLREFQEAEIIIRDGSRKNGRWRLF